MYTCIFGIFQLLPQNIGTIFFMCKITFSNAASDLCTSPLVLSECNQPTLASKWISVCWTWDGWAPSMFLLVYYLYGHNWSCFSNGPKFILSQVRNCCQWGWGNLSNNKLFHGIPTIIIVWKNWDKIFEYVHNTFLTYLLTSNLSRHLLSITRWSLTYMSWNPYIIWG